MPPTLCFERLKEAVPALLRALCKYLKLLVILIVANIIPSYIIIGPSVSTSCVILKILYHISYPLNFSYLQMKELDQMLSKVLSIERS